MAGRPAVVLTTVGGRLVFPNIWAECTKAMAHDQVDVVRLNAVLVAIEQSAESFDFTLEERVKTALGVYMRAVLPATLQRLADAGDSQPPSKRTRTADTE